MKVIYRLTILIGLILVSGCSAVHDSEPLVPPVAKRPTPFERSQALFSQGQYDAAYDENQRIFKETGNASDVALFNMGMISAHSANPKKNYGRALTSFRALVKEHPQSELIEPAKTWIQVLEEYQKVAEEKRTLVKERESLVQEKEKLKYTLEKSRQLDVEIEKRRRETLRR
ncbi:MAG: hypothetical protein EXR70_15525 [Deltaproteobacteria bacterium]|nr:hypothetical protein [Deltaproteobacteria bacterium]